MKLDRRAIQALVMLDDDRLRAVIRSFAARSGVDASTLSLTDRDLANLRHALSQATEEDIGRVARQFGLQGGGK